MPMPKLTCTTPHGTFRRWTGRPYTHVVVRALNGSLTCRTSWHLSLRAAQLSAQGAVGAVNGIYPVDGTQTEGN